MQQVNHTTWFLQEVSKHNFLRSLLGLVPPGSHPTDTLRAVHSLHSHTVPEQVCVTGTPLFSGEDRLPDLPHFQGLRGLFSPVRYPSCSPDHTNTGAGEKALWGGDPTCCPTVPSADSHLNIPSSLITSSEYYQLWGKHPHRWEF